MALEFGTAGIRGIVGNSKNHLNNAHAARVFEGFAKYINHKYNDIENKTVVIGRDNRIKGKDFANLAAKILTSYGIKVYFDNQMLATPFVSYLIIKKKALGGINITASHNPKEYNGIKLYNQFGYQMLPNEIEEVKSFFQEYEQYEHLIEQKIELIKNENVLEINDNDFHGYTNQVIDLVGRDANLSNIKIVYSALHGTGTKYIKDIFQKIKSNVIFEPNENIENENFDFVQNPNPEHEIAFANSIKLANQHGADLIIITDPDSDRIGVAYRNESNEFSFINGNENAILITDYLLQKHVNDSKLPSFLVYSFVSTSLPAKMCMENNIKSYITETGFKWIGNCIDNLKNKEKLFFAFEESYGSLVNPQIALDKDAIQGCVLMATIASMAKKENKNLNDKLNDIYQKYGYMVTKSFAYDLKNKEQLELLKEKFTQIKFDNATFFDYSKGIRNIEPNQMLSYEFNNSSNWVSLRPSGTEPKFKIYIHVVANSKEESEQLFEFIYQTVKEKLEI